MSAPTPGPASTAADPTVVSSRVTRTHAERMDAADPLAGHRSAFTIPDESLVYLDGNSLGRLPGTTLPRLATVVGSQWGDRLIRSWESSWLDLPVTVGDRLGTTLLGARPGETLVCDTVTTNIFKLLHTALDLRPGRGTVVAARADFPTDRFVAAEVARRSNGVVAWVGPLDPDAPTPVEPLRAVDLVSFLHDDVAVVLLSVVDYRTGAVADVAGITAAAHAVGALVIWDCSHAVGALEVDLPAWGVDLAVGCTYKYLNAGPGAPGWLWVDQALHAELPTPAIPGWMGHADVFTMGRDYAPAEGVRRFLTGTSSPLTLTCVDEGVAILAAVGMPAVRAKSVALTAYALELFDAWLLPLGLRLGTPRDPAERGSHLTVHHPDARALCQALTDRGVIPDFRQPDGVRLGFSPLTTRFTDVHDGMIALRELATALAAL